MSHARLLITVFLFLSLLCAKEESWALIAKYFNGDPAVAASPAITTLVDITGMAIYFTTAVVLLG